MFHSYHNFKIFSYLFIIVLLSSCATSKFHNSSVYTKEKPSLITGTEYTGGYEEPKLLIKNRKIISKAYLNMVAKEPEILVKNIQDVAKKYEGYVQESGTERCIIRVKSNSFEEAIKDIEQLGKVKQKSLSGEDVTDAYLDLEIRLENAEKARKRYLELLEKAQNVEETLKVEKELERLNEVVDLLKGKMKRIEHLSDFATITVNVREKTKPGVLGYVFMGIYEGIAWLFVRK